MNDNHFVYFIKKSFLLYLSFEKNLIYNFFLHKELFLKNILLIY
ncbi:hypothetical protein RS022_01890 [Candidatus Phytoplasma rubi]|uniref:Uncharacterized protein n=1 Tax=Candidatus Phytoplasma rubi TaxID=399025 RepID=A0ABY7BSM5_9MOLU|nr:hypothetical protein RS022_01890 [Candidatus Phytoplasma rubi]